MRKTVKTQPRSSSTPLPGRSVKGSESGRPIMAALNLLSRRWVLRILWELRDGPCGFREMQTRCDRMSPDTLSTRLAELKEVGIVESDPAGALILTPLGRKLAPALMELDAWAATWAEAVERGDIGELD